MPRSFLIALLALVFLTAASSGPAGADVIGVRAQPSAFSPNGDGERDSTMIQWTLTDSTACLVVRIVGSGTPVTPVRRFFLGAQSAGLDTFVWNGTDSTGVLLPERTYTVFIEELDADCDTAQIHPQGQVAVLLDNTAPPAPRLAHGDTTVTRPQFRVEGIAAFADTVALFRDGTRIDTTVTAPTGDAAASYGFDVVLVEGDNRFSVQSWDRAHNVSPQALDVNVIYLNTPDISAVSAVPSTFSPNGDGRADSTRMRLTLDVPTTRLVVEARRGTPPTQTIPDQTVPVAVLYDGPAPAGAQSYSWDGTDSTGTTTTDGEYVLRASSDSLLLDGTSVPGVRRSYARVVLDTTPPATPFVAPPPAAISFSNQITLDVTMTGADSLRIFRDGFPLRTDVVDDSPTPSVSAHQFPLHPGTNLVTLQAVDVAGNVSAVGGPYTVAYETPVGFHAPERFGRGDVFGVNLQSPATSIVIELFTLRGTPVRQLTATGNTTHFELPWDLKDVAGNLVGDGPYMARLLVGYANGTGQETKAAIVVVK